MRGFELSYLRQSTMRKPWTYVNQKSKRNTNEMNTILKKLIGETYDGASIVALSSRGVKATVSGCRNFSTLRRKRRYKTFVGKAATCVGKAVATRVQRF